jgi:hypothetical protein
MTSKYSVGALVGALMLAVGCWSNPANALTFHYSFQGGTIGGFISGLIDNQLDQQATSVTITVSSIGGLGEYVTPGFPNNFDVSGGAITGVSFSGQLGTNTLSIVLNSSLNNAILNTSAGAEGAGIAGVTYAAVPQVPLPAALPLFATGLGALGLLGWRRKRKQPA